MSVLVKNPGRCMAVADALSLMEQLEAQITPNQNTDLAYAMNTIRYVLAKAIPVEPKLSKYARRSTYSCGRCGVILKDYGNRFCWNCGQQINDTYLGGYKTKDEQKEFATPAQACAIEEVAQGISVDQKAVNVNLADYL